MASVADSARRTWREHMLLAMASAFIAGAVLTYYAQRWPTVYSWVVYIDDGCKLRACDFVNHYYPMGKAIYGSQKPIGGYYYSLPFALALEWFARSSRAAALTHWTAVQALATLGCVGLCYALFWKRSRIAYLVSLALLVTGVPWLHDLKWGQVGTLKLFVMLLALGCYRAGHRVAAVVLFALAVVVKYELALFALLFVLRRDVLLACAYGVLLGLLCFALPAYALGGWPPVLHFYEASVELLRGAADMAHDSVNSQYFAGVVERTWPRAWQTSVPIRLYATYLGYAVAVLNAFAAWRILRFDGEDALLWAASLFFCTLPFLVVTSWPHYFVHLSVVQGFVLLSLIESSEPWRLRLLKGLLLWLPSALLGNLAWLSRYGDWWPYAGSGALCYSNLFLLALTHLQAFSARRTLADAGGSRRGWSWARVWAPS